MENSFKLLSGQKYIEKLPDKGIQAEEIKNLLENAYETDKLIWDCDKLSGTLYKNDQNLNNLLKIANDYFMFSNPLHSTIFPSVRKMEVESIRMVLNLYNGDKSSCGIMSSGGTESILLAVKSYRDRAWSLYGRDIYEIICPITAHAAFEKACHFLSMKIVYVPVHEITMKCDIKSMKNKITKKTVLLVASCPNFPHGIIDPIEEISELALKYGIGFHVDCCLGGFVVPFCESLGYQIPLFDFRLKGVSSISCDSHKYGFSTKGSSFVLYRSSDLRSYQYFITTNWPGGIYGTPTVLGSRCGSPIATTWTSLMFHGFEGYKKSTKNIIEVSKAIVRKIKKIDGIDLLGEPKLSVIAFTSKKFDVYALLDKMTALKWDLKPIQFPSGLHICLTDIHCSSGSWKIFLVDLENSVKELLKEPMSKVTPMCALYGTSQKIPDRSIIRDLTLTYLNAYYQTTPNQQ